MVEENSGAGEQVVALAVVDGDEVAVDLGHAVGTARVKRRLLALRRFLNLAEHLAAAGLIKARPRAGLPQGVENTCNAYGGKFRPQPMVFPSGGRRGHGRPSLYFAGAELVE